MLGLAALLGGCSLWEDDAGRVVGPRVTITCEVGATTVRVQCP